MNQRMDPASVGWSAPHEFPFIDILLKLALLPLEFWAHILASAMEGDSFIESDWLEGIRNESRSDCITAFFLSMRFKL